MRQLDVRLAAAALCLAALACEGKQQEPASAGYDGAAARTGAAMPSVTPSTPPAPTAKPTSTPTATATTTATTTATETATPAAPAHAHAKVGPDKCKPCHRVEHQSWAASAHASKGLDCEGCHGDGADYRAAAVMRDPAKAAAAGLVKPKVVSCRRCHADATAALLPRAHAHKAR